MTSAEVCRRQFLCPAELLLLKSQISRESCNLCYSGLLEFRNSYVEGILCYLDFCWQGAKKMCILQQVDLRWNWSQRVKHCCTKSLGAMGLFWLLADCMPALPWAAAKLHGTTQPEAESVHLQSVWEILFSPFFVIGGCSGSSNALWAFVPGYLSKSLHPCLKMALLVRVKVKVIIEEIRKKAK